MKRKYKLDMTRPEFDLQSMSKGDVSQLNEDNMFGPLCDGSILSYVVFTVLMEANLKKSEVYEVSNDGEAIAVQLSSKSRAKEVAEKCRKEEVRFGRCIYQTNIKVRDEYLIFTIEEKD